MPDFTKCGVSIAIPNYNGIDLLEECLPSIFAALKHHGHPDNELCIADDGSTDDSVPFLSERFPEAKVAPLKENKGFSNACNAAAALCKNDVIILLNNDVKVEIDFITEILPHFNDEEVFAVTLRAKRFDMKTFQSGGQAGGFKRGFIRAWENYDVKEPQNHPLVKARKLDSFFGIGAHVAYRKSMFDKLGGFDLIYSPYIWEDTDIGYRAWKRGWVTRYEPRSEVYHKWNATLSKTGSSGKQAMISARNRLIFHWKNVGDLDMLVIHALALIVRTLFSLLTFRRSFLVPLWQALKLLPEIRAKRGEEKKHWLLSDREIFNRIKNVLKEPGVQR